MKKVKQNNRFKHELKMTSLFKNLRVSEEFETLGKNGGKAVIPGNVQKNIISIDDDIIHFICRRKYSLSYLLKTTGTITLQFLL